MMPANSDALWTRAFILLCLVQFLGYAQHAILQPTLPIYITQLGGAPFVVGLVMAAFAITSVLLRPLVGYWADRWSEAGVMNAGLLIQATSVFLCFMPFIGTIMLANGFRGIGWASLNSGGYSLLAQYAPAARRGEASGYYSGAQGSATLVLPAIALWLIDAPFGGFDVVFSVSIAIALVGAGLAFTLKRRHTGQPHHGMVPGAWWREILNVPDKGVLLASGLLFGLHISVPAVAGFLVLYAREIGIENFAWYYVVSGATSLIARPLLGWASDKIGRGAAIAAGFALEALALGIVVTASSIAGMLVSGVLFMSGNAIGSSATLAVALERADPQRRGQVMATYSMAYPLSAFVGSLLTGSAIQIAGYFWMFVFLAALSIPGVIITLKNLPSLKG
jgi:MFS family permease